MLNQTVPAFLKALNNNNNKAWFDNNRAQYEKAKSDFRDFIAAVITGIGKFDNSIATLEAKNCIFRINRDVRFSKDKRPYKNNMAGYFNKAGKKGNGAGYYLHIEPGASFIAGGIWMPEPLVLSNIRQEIDYSYKEFKKLLANPAFKKHFPKGLESSNILMRPPKGYDTENPAIELIKLKSFIVSKTFTDKEIISKDFEKEIFNACKAMKPLIDFLNRVVD